MIPVEPPHGWLRFDPDTPDTPRAADAATAKAWLGLALSIQIDQPSAK